MSTQEGGGGEVWGLQVPLQAACPSVTAGPTGMRAELFVPGEPLARAEARKERQPSASVKGTEGKCED